MNAKTLTDVHGSRLEDIGRHRLDSDKLEALASYADAIGLHAICRTNGIFFQITFELGEDVTTRVVTFSEAMKACIAHDAVIVTQFFILPEKPLNRSLEQFLLRLPADLKNRICVAAEAAGISMNSSMVQALEREFQAPQVEEQSQRSQRFSGMA